jgi:xanthine dehydrogenase accessory factor
MPLYRLYQDISRRGISIEKDEAEPVKDLYEEIVRCRQEGKPAALATVIKTEGSVPREAGSKMLVFPDGSIIDSIGGATAEAQAIEDAKHVIQTGKPQITKYDLNDPAGKTTDMICGGRMEVFIEPLVSSPTLTIFGAGHVAKSLADMANLLGWGVVVYDDRPEWANKDRFPYARHIQVGDFAELAANWQSPSPSFVVIVTHSHRTDEAVLKATLQKSWDYLGMIASRKKRAEIFDRVRAEIADPKLLEKVSSPIGLEIGSETPAEIAVSIVAEIIKTYRA